MARLASFLRLPPRERILLLQAGLTLALVKLTLLTLPFHTARQLVVRMERRAPAGGSSPARDRIVYSVTIASHLVPGGLNCLVRAVAAELMLARAGYPSELKIGVARDASGKFGAHAWLESEGKILIGQFPVGQYEPLRERPIRAIPCRRCASRRLVSSAPRRCA
jgi:Transglutaminase-like superfamily